MLDKNETLYNPRNKETFTIHKTANNALRDAIQLKYTTYSARSSLFAIKHKHPNQIEIVNVLAGTMTAQINGKTIRYSAGEMLVIKPGEPHRYWNGSNAQPLELLVEIRPALQTLDLLKFHCSSTVINNDMLVKQAHFLQVALLLKLYNNSFQLAGKWSFLKKIFFKTLIVKFSSKNSSVNYLKNKEVFLKDTQKIKRKLLQHF